jgi:hypothetical protein
MSKTATVQNVFKNPMGRMTISNMSMRCIAHNGPLVSPLSAALLLAAINHVRNDEASLTRVESVRDQPLDDRL